MAWLRVDDQFVEHDKIQLLTDRAFRLHMAALCYCARNLTDGILTVRAVKVVCAIADANRPARYLAELVSAGVWVESDDGYRIHDYLDWNPPAEKVKAERDRNADRQRRHRETRNTVDNALRNGVTDSVSNGVSNAAPSHPIPKSSLAVTQSPLQDPARQGTITNLLKATKAAPDAEKKLQRTIHKWRLTEADIAAAYEACKGPGVRDRLAVALTELKRRGQAKAAA